VIPKVEKSCCLFWPEIGSEKNRSRFGLGKVIWCDFRLVGKVPSRRFRQCMNRWLSSLVSEDLLEMVKSVWKAGFQHGCSGFGLDWVQAVAMLLIQGM
jgi:hypothetical protein